MVNLLWEPARQIPVAGDYDVIVAGGGTAGCVAAISAARNGARTLLVERSGYLGGHIATQILEHSAGFHDAHGNQIVGGIPQEIVDRLIARGASPGHVRDDTGYTRYRVPINHEEFKSVITELVAEANVTLRLHTLVSDVILDGNAVKGLIVESKSGRQVFTAKVVVDCTGDADVAAHAGAPFSKGREEDGLTQPATLIFKLAGIDFKALLEYVQDNAQDFKLGVPASELFNQPYVNLWGFGTSLAEAYADGMLSLYRREMHFAGWADIGMAVVNVTRSVVDGTDADSLSRAEIVLRQQILEFLQFFRNRVPGCQNCYLVATAGSVGVRESRRIQGLYQLTDADVRTGRRFEDAVLQGGFPVDSHDPMGHSMEAAEQVSSAYDIPYRCLLPKAVESLIVAGRSISATRKALASARVTATCMAMGQAAGTAAALSVKLSVPPRLLDVALLQRALREQGVLLHQQNL